MTKFLLLMWAADIAGGISVISIVALIGFSGAFLFGTLFNCLGSDLGGGKIPIWKKSKWLLIPIFVGVISPSDKTIYAYLLASTGKDAIETQMGQKAVKTLDMILDQIQKKVTK